jgi:putative acetyltransferase
LGAEITVQIRIAAECDLVELGELFRNSVEKVGPQRYTPEQVRAWASMPNNPARLRKFVLGVTTFVAEDGGRLVGLCGLGADGHLASLYVDGTQGRKGIGSMLLDKAILEARARGLVRLHTEASEFSKPLFEKFGFETIEVEHVIHEGVGFKRYRMQLTLEELDNS